MLEFVNPQSLRHGHVLRRMELRCTGATVRVCGTNLWRPVQAWAIGHCCFNELSAVWTDPDQNDWRMPVRHSWDVETYFTKGYKPLERVTCDHQFRVGTQDPDIKEPVWNEFQPADYGKLLTAFQPPLNVRCRRMLWLNPEDVQCPPSARFEGDIVGCGSYRISGPDSEGLLDCLDCGLFFSKEDDQRGIPHDSEKPNVKFDTPAKSDGLRRYTLPLWWV